MLANLVDSQPQMICISSLFEMTSIIARIEGYVERSALANCDYSDARFRLNELQRGALKAQLISNLSRTMQLFGLVPENKRNDAKIHQLSLDDYHRVVDAILFENTPEGRNPLSYIGQTICELELVAARWRVSHNYAPVFLQHHNSYWLEIVRHPRDRYVSAKLSHGEDIFRSCAVSQSNFEFAAAFQHDRYRVVRYEDIVANPQQLNEMLSTWLGVSISSHPFKDAFGEPVRPNSSQNIILGCADDRADPMAENAIVELDQSWKHNYVTPVEEQILHDKLRLNPFYSLPCHGGMVKRKARSRIMTNSVMLMVRHMGRDAITYLKDRLPTH